MNSKCISCPKFPGENAEPGKRLRYPVEWKGHGSVSYLNSARSYPISRPVRPERPETPVNELRISGIMAVESLFAAGESHTSTQPFGEFLQRLLKYRTGKHRECLLLSPGQSGNIAVVKVRIAIGPLEYSRGQPQKRLMKRTDATRP